jgi:hypothetical protein
MLPPRKLRPETLTLFCGGVAALALWYFSEFGDISFAQYWPVLMPFLWLLYLLTIWRALNECSTDSRRVSPRFVWLMLIPLVNLFCSFILVRGLSQSLENEQAARRVDTEPSGRLSGMAMCILLCLATVGLFLLPQSFLSGYFMFGFFGCWIAHPLVSGKALCRQL